MTDLQARVVAAIQQVRTSTPRECDEWCETIADSGFDGLVSHSNACVERWAAKVDARLAACVEAMLEAAICAPEGRRVHAYTLREAGLAAFQAAAAPEERV